MRQKLLFIIFLAIIYGFQESGTLSADGEALTIYYFDRPPYYIAKTTAPRGFIIDFTYYIATKAGFNVTFKEMPPKRILETLKEPFAACSAGWFKTPEREREYLFSRPIYQDHPLVLVTTMENKLQDLHLGELDYIIKSVGHRFALPCGFSYGKEIDPLFSKDQKEKCVSTVPQNIFHMIALGRIDFTLSSPEEAGFWLSNDRFLGEKLAVVQIRGLTTRNKRYLMCSKDVPQAILKVINDEITNTVGWLED